MPNNTGGGPYVSAYVVQSDYIDEAATADELEYRLARLAIHSPRAELITALCTVNLVAGFRTDLLDKVTAEYCSLLPQEMAARLKAVILQTEPPRRLLARQALLKTLRLVLVTPEAATEVPLHPLVKAIAMSHCVAEGLDHEPSDTDTSFSYNVSVELAVSLVQNYLFNRQQDIYMRIQRSDEIWRVHGQDVDRSILGRTADELFGEATGGLDRRDVFAVGFGLLAHALQWGPQTPFTLQNLQLANDTNGRADRVLAFMSSTPSELAAQLVSAHGEWALEAFEGRDGKAAERSVCSFERAAGVCPGV